MAGTSQREIVVNHNHDNEMWTLKSKTNNNTQYTNEINRERSSKSLDGYNTRDSILGNVLTWSDRPESDEQKRHKTEHKTIKKTQITIPISPLPPNAAEKKRRTTEVHENLYSKISINARTILVNSGTDVPYFTPPLTFYFPIFHLS